MEKITQLHHVTPKELTNAILAGVEEQLIKFQKDFQPKEPSEYMSRKEVASLFSVSLVTIYEWDKKNILNPQRIGSRVRYIRREVESALKEIRGEGNE